MDLRSQFHALTLQSIDDYITNAQEENLFLDFKEAATSDLSSRDDKKNLAKAMSGFANSQGGIIVWGVEARKNGNNVDCAIAKKPIADVNQFVSRLNSVTGQFTTPIVEGIEHRKIIEAGTSGYALTFVPESDSGPHRAIGGGVDQYIKRSGDSFYTMEHFDLEDMFGRRRKPRLSIEPRLMSGSIVNDGSPSAIHYIEIILELHNKGRGVAKYPYASLEFISEHRLDTTISGGAVLNLPEIKDWGNNKIKRFGAVDGFVIHPSMFLQVGRIRLQVNQNTTTLNDLLINTEFAAENFPLTKTQLLRTGSQLLLDIRTMKGWTNS